MREHRLYQADWLMRFYQFKADEILSAAKPNFNLYLDPKSNWAIQNYEAFPINVQTAPYPSLLRIPGVGPKSAGRIMQVRQHHQLDYSDLIKLGVVMKRARHFIACKDYRNQQRVNDPQRLIADLMSIKEYQKLTKLNTQSTAEQLTLFDPEFLRREKQREVGVSG